MVKVNDLDDNHHRRLKLTIKDSNSTPLTHVTDNPLDDFSNFDDQTNSPTGIFSSNFCKEPSAATWKNKQLFTLENFKYFRTLAF